MANTFSSKQRLPTIEEARANRTKAVRWATYKAQSLFCGVIISGGLTAFFSWYALYSESDALSGLTLLFLCIFGWFLNDILPISKSYREASEKWASALSTHEDACSLVMSGNPFLLYLRSFSGERRHEEIDSPAAYMPTPQLRALVENMIPTSRHVWYTQGVLSTIKKNTSLPIVQESNWADPNISDIDGIFTIECGPHDWAESFRFLAERATEIVLHLHKLSFGITEELKYLNNSETAIKVLVVYEEAWQKDTLSNSFPKLSIISKGCFLQKKDKLKKHYSSNDEANVADSKKAQR